MMSFVGGCEMFDYWIFHKMMEGSGEMEFVECCGSCINFNTDYECVSWCALTESIVESFCICDDYEKDEKLIDSFKKKTELESDK
nr:MAG: hypothetical protein [Helarchaeota virus Nidhogg Meg22_1012]